MLGLLTTLAASGFQIRVANPVVLKCLLFLAAVIHGKAADQRLTACSRHAGSMFCSECGPSASLRHGPLGGIAVVEAAAYRERLECSDWSRSQKWRDPVLWGNSSAADAFPGRKQVHYCMHDFIAHTAGLDHPRPTHDEGHSDAPILAVKYWPRHGLTQPSYGLMNSGPLSLANITMVLSFVAPHPSTFSASNVMSLSWFLV